MTPSEIITIAKNCSPVVELQCVQLFLNDTQTFLNFTRRYAHVINKLFDENMQKTTPISNALFVFIKYDSIDVITLDLIQALDNTPNRTYNNLRLIMNNRGNRTVLLIDASIQNTTFALLQLYIDCGAAHGWDVFNYIGYMRLVNFIECKIPTTATTITTTTTTYIPSTTLRQITTLTSASKKTTIKRTLPTTIKSTTESTLTSTKKIILTSISFTTINTAQSTQSLTTILTSTINFPKPMTSTKRIERDLVIMFSLIIGGCILPCLILACCLYILCVNDNHEYDTDINEGRFSITDSISNVGSATSNGWSFGPF